MSNAAPKTPEERWLACEEKWNDTQKAIMALTAVTSEIRNAIIGNESYGQIGIFKRMDKNDESILKAFGAVDLETAKMRVETLAVNERVDSVLELVKSLKLTAVVIGTTSAVIISMIWKLVEFIKDK